MKPAAVPCNSIEETDSAYTGRFKRSFTTLKTYTNLLRGYVENFELT
jgi:hypothetical protein